MLGGWYTRSNREPHSHVVVPLFCPGFPTDALHSGGGRYVFAVYQCSDLALITAAAMSASATTTAIVGAAATVGTAPATTAAVTVTSSGSTSSAAGDRSGAVGDGGGPVGELLQAASDYVHHLVLNPVVAGDAGAAVASGAVSPVVAFSLLTAAVLKSSQLPVTSLFARSMEGPTPTSAIGYAGLSPHIGVVLLASTMPLWCVLRWCCTLVWSLLPPPTPPLPPPSLLFAVAAIVGALDVAATALATTVACTPTTFSASSH